uniref:RING finger protein 207 n=1 Tax=Erpetoichthys calabaricus TaxID=27687 RepID=A0A8C4S1T2_ERPCA
MSGGIFSPMDSFFNIDSANCHPLVCHLCHEQYEHPCLLDCYHTFCASCLRGRAVDSRLSCPLCGHQSIVKGSNGLPPEDRLLNSWWTTLQTMRKQSNDVDSMYYCNTCNQPLCGTCREDTHKAKMFSRHEIVSLAKRTKEIHKKCSLHEELYIMFSTEKKSMLCINCFRDMQVESRAHCIDIETAYMQGCEKLDQAVMAVKELQTSAREAIILLKAMIGEVRTNVDEEESAISTLFNNMQVNMLTCVCLISSCIPSQHEEKERAFKEQLSHLSALLPTLQVHLVTCSAFLSSANKFEFLDLGYQLMERLKKIVKLPHRLKPSQSSKINTDYRSEFARCLEPLLILNHRRSVSLTGNTSASSLVGPCHSPSTSDMSLSASVVRKPTSHRYISTKVLLAEGTETSFTEHCRNYENTYRTLQTEIQKLKDQVQEIHRDLDQKSLQIDVQIASEYSSGGDDEDYVRRAQLHDLLQLKQENSYLTTITKQIGPYIRSIAKVKEQCANPPAVYKHSLVTDTYWNILMSM